MVNYYFLTGSYSKIPNSFPLLNFQKRERLFPLNIIRENIRFLLLILRYVGQQGPEGSDLGSRWTQKWDFFPCRSLVLPTTSWQSISDAACHLVMRAKDTESYSECLQVNKRPRRVDVLDFRAFFSGILVD